MNNQSSLVRFLLKFIYYFSRLISFVFISIRVVIQGIISPKILFNFLFGVVTEIAEFHKRCRKNPINFNTTDLYKDIVSQIFLSKSNCFNVDFGSIRPQEAQVVGALLVKLQPKNIFEFGTYKGFSTLHLLENSSNDTKIFTLDLPLAQDSANFRHDLVEAHRDMKNIEHNTERYFVKSPRKNQIIELFGDSMTFDYSPYVGKIDFIFIDANHSYSYVKSDTENALKMLSSGGVILWHDYDFIHPGIFKYINELSRSKKIYFIERTRYAFYIKD